MRRTFLGLTHNPFVPPQEGFFTGGDRKTQLDQVRHLSQWSRRVLAVTGNYGIGKSTLFRELSNSLDPKAKGARLSGNSVNSEREVAVGLANGFGIAVSSEVHADEIYSLVATHVEEQAELGRVCMAMIDDAHQLDAAAITSLLQVVSESSLRIVFFAEATIIGTMTKSAKRLDLEWFEIRLTGLAKKDASDYLEWRFAQSQYRGSLPFTDAQVDKIVGRTGGNLHAINQLASQLLSDLETGEVRRGTGKFPMAHAVLSVLIVAIVGLVYVLVQSPDEVGPEGDQTLAQAATARDSTSDVAGERVESVDSASRLDTTRDGQMTGETSRSSTDGGSLDAAVLASSAIEAEKQANRDANPGQRPNAIRENTEDALAASVRAEEQRVAQQLAAEAAAREQAARESAAKESAAKESAARESAAREERARKERQQAQEQSAIQVREASTSVTQPQSDAVSTAVDPTINGSNWLLQQDPNRYTLQLVTLSSLDRAQALVRRQDDKSEFAIYPSNKGDRSLFVITYGVFSSRDAAVNASRQLKGELAKLNPWIRPLNLVQDAIRQG